MRLGANAADWPPPLLTGGDQASAGQTFCCLSLHTEASRPTGTAEVAHEVLPGEVPAALQHIQIPPLVLHANKLRSVSSTECH